jgi:hypothetical protein
MDLFRNSCLRWRSIGCGFSKWANFSGCVMEVKPIGVFFHGRWWDRMKSNLCTGIWSNMEFIKWFVRYEPTPIKRNRTFLPGV